MTHTRRNRINHTLWRTKKNIVMFAHLILFFSFDFVLVQFVRSNDNWNNNTWSWFRENKNGNFSCFLSSRSLEMKKKIDTLISAYWKLFRIVNVPPGIVCFTSTSDHAIWSSNEDVLLDIFEWEIFSVPWNSSICYSNLFDNAFQIDRCLDVELFTHHKHS